jgi:hypothetical protein
MIRATARLLALALAASALLPGCVTGYYPGGQLASNDQYTYESTPDFPQTVTLVDPTTGERLWSVDIPIGQQLVMQFREGANKGDEARPDMLVWGVMKMGQRSGSLDNSMPVPPAWQRRVDVTHRKGGAVPERPAPTAG